MTKPPKVPTALLLSVRPRDEPRRGRAAHDPTCRWRSLCAAAGGRSVDKAAMGRRRNAIFLTCIAAAAVGASSLPPRAHGADLHSVLSGARERPRRSWTRAEDLAASSQECASQTAMDNTQHHVANDPASGTGDGESTKAPRVPSRDRGSRVDGSGDAPRHRQRASRDEGHAPTMRPSSAL
jgi:hypothetical protein